MFMLKRPQRVTASSDSFLKRFATFLKNLKKYTKNHPALVAFFTTALFIAVQLPVLFQHEIWLDEGISWELSKQINLQNVYEVNAAEPHPILWQIILAPFSQNHFPAITLSFISLTFVALAVFLLVRYTPLNYFTKLIFILSSGFFYFNPIIARDYSLIPLAICLICLTYKSRHQKPLFYSLALVFLTQTHFLTYGLAGILTLGFIFEELLQKNQSFLVKLRHLIILIVPIAFSLLSVAPLVFSSMQHQAILNGYTRTHELPSLVQTSFAQHAIQTYFGFYVSALEVVVYVALILVLINALAENLKLGLYLLVSLAFWVFCLVFVYDGYSVFYQKVSIITLIFIATTWLFKLEGESSQPNFVSKLLNFSEIIKFFRLYAIAPTGIALVFLVACSVPFTIAFAKKDFHSAFSGSRSTAKFVNEQVEPGSLIIEADGQVATNTFNAAVLAQLNNQVTFYNVPLRTSNDYYLKLRYASADKKALLNDGFNEEELATFLQDTTLKYDHIYYVDSIPGCGNAKPYNYEILNAYPMVRVLGGEKYLTPTERPAKVYKIK